jgi:hypothetical protein
MTNRGKFTLRALSFVMPFSVGLMLANTGFRIFSVEHKRPAGIVFFVVAAFMIFIAFMAFMSAKRPTR